MKKLVIISLAIFGLGIVSCQKEVLTPNTGSEMDVPVWEEDARFGEETIDTDDSGIDDVIVGGITDPNDENDDPITDPNDDNGKTKGTRGSNLDTEGHN